MQELSRDEYISEIKYCYENSRWEFSFYAVLYSFFCQFRTEQIKLVHCADWKSRGANTSSFMSANLENCSIKITGNDGKNILVEYQIFNLFHRNIPTKTLIKQMRL
jgi:hypothetical protein